MPDRINQLLSYGVSGATASASYISTAPVEPWTLAEFGVLAGVAGVVVRIYIDLSRHIDRKRGLERRKMDRSKCNELVE